MSSDQAVSLKLTFPETDPPEYIVEIREALALLGKHVDELRQLTAAATIDLAAVNVAALYLSSYATAVEKMAEDLAGVAAVA